MTGWSAAGLLFVVMSPRLLAIGMVAVAALTAATPAAAGKPATLMAEYNFDAVHQDTVVDLTGRGHALSLGGNWSHSNGVSTPAVSFDPVSLGNSPSRSDLNSGFREFAITMVFRLPGDTSQLPDTPNIVQKGFWGDAGQWKMQLKPKTAAIQCRFQGTVDARLVTSQVADVDDGEWHMATCWRDGTLLGVTVDGVTDELTASVGDISNGRPLRVGAKNLSSTTDQFTGALDYVALAFGDGAIALSQEAAPLP